MGAPGPKFDAFKFDAYVSCGSGNVTLSFCHVKLRGHMIKGPCDLVSYHCLRFDVYRSYGSGDAFLFCLVLYKRELLNLSYHCPKFDIYRSYGSGNITLMMIKGTCDLVSGNPST